ncbi:MAG TPA: glutamine amidotransferase [Planctomycetota bacterium]
MRDRLLFFFVASSPLLVMFGAWLVYRWRTAPSRKAFRDTLLVLALVAIPVAWVIYTSRSAKGLSAHVHMQRPQWLLLSIPLFAIILLLQHYTQSGISRGRKWGAFFLRCSILILLLLALSGLQMVVQQDVLTVLYALDVSKSVPESERQRALSFINKTIPAKKADDKAGLLVFGGRAEWECAPTTMFKAPDVRQIKALAAPDATNIELALKRALSRSDEDTQRRLVLFTDGRQTIGDALEELKRVVSLGVDVWIVPLKRGTDAEMLIEKLELPRELLWEQPFDVHVFVYSNITANARVHLYLGDKASGNPPPQDVALTPGKNRVTFRGMRMHSGGAKEVRAVLEPLSRADDTLSENNEAYAFTDVQTENRVLIMTSDVAEVKHLLAALEDQKMTLDVRSGASLPDNPETYRAYDCIVLANLARGFLSEQQMKVIESCVKDQGAGLVMIGGDQSFGAGGYLNTPIEDALPVQMDLKNQKVMPSGALCIVLHTCEFGDGNAWGKKISKAAIKTLSPQDYAGLIYFSHMGTGETWCFKPTLIANRINQLFGMIDNCEPGDMPSLDTIVSMAVNSLANLPNVSLKHCIIISDGDPSPPTGMTVAAAKKAKITISTISIFPHGGAEIDTLKKLAAETNGSYYSPDDPRKLPQIFIKEAAVVRKSLIRQDAEHGIPVALSAAGATLKEFGSNFPKTTAFVVTTPKDRAEMQLYTTVEGEKLPILMSWHYGLGKAVAFTSDSTNRWSPDWVAWSGYKKFWTNILTWVSRQRMPSNHTVTTRIEGGVAHVTLESLDEHGNYLNFAKLTGNAVDPELARNGPDGKTFDLNFSMTAPGRYEATFPVEKPGAYAITIVDQSNAQRPNAIITGLANSYSPEFLYLEGDDALLSKMGEMATRNSPVSRLKNLDKLDPLKCGVFTHDLPLTAQPQDLFWPLLVLALCLFPFDVAIRRLALDPEKAALAIWALLEPLVGRLRSKQQQLTDAAKEAITGKPVPPPPPPDIVPTGAQSREAQSRYEQMGGAEGKDFDLKPKAEAEGKSAPAVGGTKISQADDAASDYTRALLKAKKRAKRDDET